MISLLTKLLNMNQSNLYWTPFSPKDGSTICDVSGKLLGNNGRLMNSSLKMKLTRLRKNGEQIYGRKWTDSTRFLGALDEFSGIPLRPPPSPFLPCRMLKSNPARWSWANTPWEVQVLPAQWYTSRIGGSNCAGSWCTKMGCYDSATARNPTSCPFLGPFQYHL